VAHDREEQVDNENDPITNWPDAGLPDCKNCSRPEKKHRASDNLCPPKEGSLFNVRYWIDGPQTFYMPEAVERPDAEDGGVL
jgi:hypothetical protein